MANETLADNAPFNQPDLYSRGESLSAGKLNDGVRAFRHTTTGIAPPVQVMRKPAAGSASGAIVGRFKLITNPVRADHILANPFGADGLVNTGEVVRIAKPYLLREAVTSRTINGNVMTFVGLDTGYTRRNVSITISPDTVTETQKIVPSYVEGDEIRATMGIVGGTGASYTDTDGQPIAITWEDDNTEGRKWCRET